MQKIPTELLQDIIDFQANIIILTNGNEMVFANRSMLEFFGCDSLEMFKKSHKCICEHFVKKDGFLTNEYNEWIKQHQENIKNNKESFVLIIRSDKEYIFRVQMRTLPSDPIYSIITLEDMSLFFETKALLEHNNRLLELKIQERTWELLESSEELENQKEALEETQAIANLGSWVFTVSDKLFSASKELYMIFGYEAGIEIKPLVLLRYLYKKDRQKLFDYLRALKAQKEVSGVNLRIIDLHKQQKTVRFYAKAFLDDFGNIYRVQGALQDITESVELKERAFYDHLTKIYNRRRMSELVEEMLDGEKPLGLIMFDIDHFKSINDTYGHPVGDSVLVEIADIVKFSLSKDAVFARWGGEEFLVAIPDANTASLLICANRLKEAVAEYGFEGVGRVTCSFGAIIYNENESFFEGIKRCDDALYLAKKHGRNCVVEG